MPTANEPLPPEDTPIGPPPPPGEPTRVGRYVVIGKAGSGGQADVYRVSDPALARELVLKIHRLLYPPGSPERDALVAEGRMLAQLKHPNLAQVHDLGFHQDRAYLVMEYVRGATLEQYRQAHAPGPRETALLVARLARALAVPHARGIVHRDLKPRNVLIDQFGQPYIIDFGLARLNSAWADAQPGDHGYGGTPAYTAPEQARCETERIDQRTDLFALGGVLYYLLTGKAPFADRDSSASLARARRCDFDRTALDGAGSSPDSEPPSWDLPTEQWAGGQIAEYPTNFLLIGRGASPLHRLPFLPFFACGTQRQGYTLPSSILSWEGTRLGYGNSQCSIGRNWPCSPMRNSPPATWLRRISPAPPACRGPRRSTSKFV